MAWEEAGLTTQTTKSRFYVQPSARSVWGHYLESTPRNILTELHVQGILDGSERVDHFDMGSSRIWPEDNGMNVLGTPLGSSQFVTSYLHGKGLKHMLLLQFIEDVVAVGFPREAEQMLKGAAIPRLSHILRSA